MIRTSKAWAGCVAACLAVTVVSGTAAGAALRPVRAGAEVSPTRVMNLYGLPSTSATQQGNAIAVIAPVKPPTLDQDVAEFLKTTRPDLPAPSFAVADFHGGAAYDPTNQDQVADSVILTSVLEWILALGNGVPVTVIYTPDTSVRTQIDVLKYLNSQNSAPTVVVLPVNIGPDSAVPATLADSFCQAAMKLGASVLVPSGDDGVGAGSAGASFAAEFPATCPFVTAVGGTQGLEDETGWAGSGGGFSTNFSRPAYQQGPVTSYLNTIGDQNAGLYSRGGRAVPDVSAQADDLKVRVDGKNMLFTGTALATAIFAATIALLDDELIAAGKPPLGFLNPLLYSTGAAALRDVTSGNNPGAGTSGFPAAAGWDPVTGLGTPRYAALRTAAGL